MSTFRKKKKREATPEQKVARLRSILIVLALAAAAVFLAPTPKGKEQRHAADTAREMDARLDSLIASLGFTVWDVTEKGQIEEGSEEAVSPLQDSIEKTMASIRALEAMETPTTAMQETAGRLAARLDSLRSSVSDTMAPRRYTARRVRFTDADGRRYTFFQTLYDDGTCAAQYFKETLPEKARQTYEKIEKALNESKDTLQ